ncbi:MAG: ABC transporter substrate-binding protein, partial [Gemmatimonadetes bacterium]|nr:ABC transporter substrate-binding protein [Gemmatimonadota bacterium]
MPIYILLLATLPFIACSGDEGALKKVPRNRTLIIDCAEANTCAGQIQDYNSFNPFIPGGISRIGFNFLYEPLYFFNAYEENSELIPWIAESHHFNEDYTELVVKIRPGVEWSDGHPWSAHDFAFTINMLVEHAPQLMYSTDMATWVEEAVALDSLTARITLKAPNPRFLFSYFVHSGDQGVPIVPKHIWEDKDPLTFANFDLQKGWPVLTGPYRIARSEPAQRIWDLREGWWAEKIGFQEPPQVERLIYLTYMEEHKRVQNLIANNIDTCLELRPANIVSLLERNRNITTWTGREPPYSYITWWPISLGFNGLEAPWSDPEMRRAVNYAIDREQLVAIGWQNSGAWTLLP